MPDLNNDDDNIPFQNIGGQADNPPPQPVDLSKDLEINNQEILVQHLQVEFVLTHWDSNPTMQIWERARDAEATRLLSQFFYKSTTGNNSVLIPECWSNFFTVMLLSPINFAWAREFLTSNAFKLFNDANVDNGSIEFNIPVRCPTNGKTLCLSEIVEEKGLEDNEKNKGKSKETELESLESSAIKSTLKRKGS